MASRIIFLLALEARSSSSVSKIEKPGAVNCVGDAVSDAARSELGNSLPGATAVPALCPRETVDMKGGFDAVSCTFSFATGCQGEFSAPPPGCVKAETRVSLSFAMQRHPRYQLTLDSFQRLLREQKARA